MISVAFCGSPLGTLGAIQSHFGYHGFHFVALGQPCWGRGNPQKATESTPKYKKPKTRFLSLSVGTLLGHQGIHLIPSIIYNHVLDVRTEYLPYPYI